MTGNVNETPTMAQVLQDAFEGRLCNLHTAMPGRILSYDASKQTAKIQPELKRKFRDGSVLDIPVISDVPVVMPRAGKAFISLPLKPGDQVLLIFAERSLDTWKVSGGSVDPTTESRKHDFSDAFAIPGGYPESNPAEMSADDVLIVNDKSRAVLKPGGKFLFEKVGGDEILDLLVETICLISTTTTNTVFGPLQNNDFVKFKELANRLKALKG